MGSLQITRHGRMRCAQRGLSADELDLIMLIGSEVDDGYLVRDKDCQEVVRQLKNEIKRVQRVKGKRVVLVNGQIIAAFHATRSEMRRVLRRSEERGLEVAA